MNNMTSVQMVITAFYQYRYDNPYLVELFDKAVKIHEQEIKDAYNQGFRDASHNEQLKDISEYENAQNYYNETFKNEN